VPAERAAAETAAEHLLQRGLAEPVSA